MWSPTFPRAESAVPTVSSILTMLACGVWWNPPEFLNDFVIKRFFSLWKNAALKGTLPLPPNFTSGKEGESAQVWAPDSQDRIFWGRKDWMDWGWSWGWGLPDRTEISAAGDGTLLLSHLSSAMQVLSRRCIPNCFDHSSGDDQCLSHPLIKMLLDSRFPRLLHIL